MRVIRNSAGPVAERPGFPASRAALRHEERDASCRVRGGRVQKGAPLASTLNLLWA